MSKNQRNADLKFLRSFAATSAGTWRNAINHAADALEKEPLDGAAPKAAAEPEPEPESE